MAFRADARCILLSPSESILAISLSAAVRQSGSISCQLPHSSSIFLFRAFSSFLSSGAGARHLQHFRQQCFEILSKSLQVINDTFPSGTIAEMPRGGLFIWIQLPQGIDTALLSDIAKQHDITIALGKIFSSPAGEYNNCIRVNCLAMPWNVNTLEKLSLLGKIATSLIRKN